MASKLLQAHVALSFCELSNNIKLTDRRRDDDDDRVAGRRTQWRDSATSHRLSAVALSRYASTVGILLDDMAGGVAWRNQPAAASCGGDHLASS